MTDATASARQRRSVGLDPNPNSATTVSAPRNTVAATMIVVGQHLPLQADQCAVKEIHRKQQSQRAAHQRDRRRNFMNGQARDREP